MHTILIVDDDQVSLTLLTKLVEKLNFNVLQARDGAEAQALIKNHAVDLVIADYEMPVCDGLQLLKIVKAEFPRLPFILVTAYSNVRVIREAWECGAFDFFQKPVFVDRLNQTIHLAIEYGHLAIARRKFPKLQEQEPDPELIEIGVLRELAVALDAPDLATIVAEYDVHARIELEQLFRFAHVKKYAQVKEIAHRLAGTSLNLGLAKVAKQLRVIEMHPDKPIRDPQELEQVLFRSIYWLQNCLSQILHDMAS